MLYDRKCARTLLLILVAVVSAVPAGLIAAQDDGFQVHETSVFTVQVPDWIQMQESGAQKVVYSDGESSITFEQVEVSQDTQDLLGENFDAILSLIQLLFAGTDYEVGECPSDVALPCLQFSDPSAVLKRVGMYDAVGKQLFLVSFAAPDEGGLARLQADAVLSSFALVSSSTVTATSGGDVLFNVTVNGNVNIRDCAGTGCAQVGQAQNGKVLEVVGEEGDWYEVNWEGGTAYIAAWLTTRAPGELVDLYEGYFDLTTMCTLYLRASRGDSDFDVAITGENYEDVWVDIYRPNETVPVRVDAQYDKTFIDTGDPYIHQVYPWNSWWPNGVYQVELRLGDKTSRISFEVNQTATHMLYVLCE